MRHYYKTAVWTACFVLLSISTPISASGAFSPFSGDIGNAEFNKGKAIYSGRVGPQGCTDCHNSFNRSQLTRLPDSVSAYITNCNKHKPCYDNISEQHKNSLNTYFNRRYRLQ